MKVKLNSNAELVREVRKALKETGGYCPCAVFKTDDTECMCKDFREQISQGIIGECKCGLYEVVEDDKD